jgi:hypothetical protein
MMLDGKQIKDASIAAAKLANGIISALLRADGSVTWTGNANAGGQKLTNLGAPTASTDAARLQDVQNVPWKAACRAASTANLTLSGTQTIDGVVLIANDRVLAKNQTTAAANGIYVVAAGAWSRAADNDSSAEMSGAVVAVNEGTSNADSRWACTTDAITLDTTALTFVNIGTGTPAAFDTASNKAMTASVTSADNQPACATTVAATPAGDGYVRVSVNGAAQTVGDGVKTKDCYFTADSGATAKTIANIAAGDTLYWVQSVAGFNLAATDVVDFEFNL